MPTIAVISPKGGAGKTTLSNVLATTYSNGGATVAIMDCDTQKNQKRWKEGKDGELEVLTKCDIEVVADITEDDFFPNLKRLCAEKQFVILDTPGRASLIISYAIMRADLVLIPVKPSPNDIQGAIEAIRLVRREAQVRDRDIKFACVMVETPGSDAFKSKIHREFEKFTAEEKVVLLETQLREREAYRALFMERVALHELDPKQVSSVPKAIANAEDLAGEVFQLLTKIREAA